jgi:hypothetical protein
MVSTRGGLRHELKFDPFAAFLESAEFSPPLHRPALVRPDKIRPDTDSSRKYERRDQWAAPFSLFSLYIQHSKLAGVNRQGLGTLYLEWFH